MGAEGIVCGEVGLAEMDMGGGRIVCGEVGLTSKGLGMILENSAGLDNIGVEKEVGLNTSGERLLGDVC